MSKRKPPLTDFQKTIYTSEEQEVLKLGAHIIKLDYSDDDIERAKELVQAIRQLTGKPPLSEDELNSMIERAKNLD